MVVSTTFVFSMICVSLGMWGVVVGYQELKPVKVWGGWVVVVLGFVVVFSGVFFLDFVGLLLGFRSR